MIPGYGTPVSNDPTSILASQHGWILEPVTIASGEGECEKGQVLGIVTATGKYAKYDDLAADGTEVAVAILADKVDATSSDQLCNAYVRGYFVTAKLTGMDANGLADLNGREIGLKTLI